MRNDKNNMNRLLITAIKIAIAALLLTLIVIIAITIFSPVSRLASRNRRLAVSGLFGTDGSLYRIRLQVEQPLKPSGTIANLDHFLSKNPGSSHFKNKANQRRAENYLAPLMPELEKYRMVYADDSREWLPDFLAAVRVLFEQVKSDIYGITGIPDSMLDIRKPPVGAESAIEGTEAAIAEFAAVWVPPGKNIAAIDKELIREYFLKSRRFKKSMLRIDNAWKALIAKLYNISVNPNWQLAAVYDAALNSELNDLIVIVLSADIYRRGRDIMSGISPSGGIGISSAGIQWMPSMSFYKNIPEITGSLKDSAQIFFFVKANIGYTFQDVRTQTWLNQHKDWLSDYIKTYFSNLYSDDIQYLKSDVALAPEWKLAILKADIIHPINLAIVKMNRFGARKVYGVREIAFSRINLIEDR
ncbi:MAG: hypothetical protein B0D92_04190 [Spirochaeta sp. LUC14_002_19_P3]|nr:MAG: hypothetical protein B0D92_04190 [Spirochaeta sp. LUC14_002_19_P3]